MHTAILLSPFPGQALTLGLVAGTDAVAELVGVILGVVLWLGGILGLVSLVHFLLTLPMRRAERARLFLDLLEGALQRGQPVEAMVLSAARSGDPALGAPFHSLAARIEGGLRFKDALERAPRFLPPQISAILRAGDTLGDLRRVLPACREILREHPAGVRSALHYMLMVVFFFSPAFVAVVLITMLKIVPKFKEIAANLMHAQLWPITRFVFAHGLWLVTAEIAVALFLFAGAAAYIAGPRLTAWFQWRGLPLVDWLAWKLAWKRKALQRTFSAMLAVLLDGGVPEASAIRLAGDCTANEICRRRARRAIAALEQGVKLDEAVRAFDDTGEFHWRLANATHARGGFLEALDSWHESLDAKAFQQEQAAAHALTTAVVILNGVFVALVATAMFGVLIAVVNGQMSP